MREMVVKEVSTAVENLRHSLTEVLMEGQSLATKKLGADLGLMVNSLRNEQLKFQTEVKSTITGLQSLNIPVHDKVEGSTNHLKTTPENPNSIWGVWMR